MIVCEEQPAFTVDEPAPGQAYGVSLLPAAHPVLASAVLARTHACSGSEMSGEICSWPGRAGAVERGKSTRVEYIEYIPVTSRAAGAGQGQASL